VVVAVVVAVVVVRAASDVVGTTVISTVVIRPAVRDRSSTVIADTDGWSVAVRIAVVTTARDRTGADEQRADEGETSK
jgi:hypothetical protein